MRHLPVRQVGFEHESVVCASFNYTNSCFRYFPCVLRWSYLHHFGVTVQRHCTDHCKHRRRTRFAGRRLRPVWSQIFRRLVSKTQLKLYRGDCLVRWVVAVSQSGRGGGGGWSRSGFESFILPLVCSNLFPKFGVRSTFLSKKSISGEESEHLSWTRTATDNRVCSEINSSKTVRKVIANWLSSTSYFMTNFRVLV